MSWTWQWCNLCTLFFSLQDGKAHTDAFARKKSFCLPLLPIKSAKSLIPHHTSKRKKNNYQSVKSWQSAVYFSRDLIQARCSSVFPKQHRVAAFTAWLSASQVNGWNQVWSSVQFLYPSSLRGLGCYLSTGTSTLQNHPLAGSTVVSSPVSEKFWADACKSLKQLCCWGGFVGKRRSNRDALGLDGSFAERRA